MEPLHKELMDLIVEVCEITGPVPEDMRPEAALVGPDSPLGLDSLDAVEIAVAVQTRYNIRITDREAFASLQHLADHIGKAN